MSRIKTAVILGAGMGSRLNNITEDKIPKGLLNVNGKTLVERSIEKLRSLGIENIYIVTGHLNEFYDELAKGTNYIHTKKNRRYRSTGSMESLAVLENEINEDFLLLESDLIYEVYALVKVINFNEDDCVLLSGRTNSGDECYVEVRDENLFKISKDINDIEKVYGELVGISKISLDLYKEMLKEYKNKKSDFYDYESIEGYYVNGNKCKYDYDCDNKKADKWDYEEVIFDVARKRKIGYFKIEDLLWGEIDDDKHLERINNLIIPKLEKEKFN